MKNRLLTISLMVIVVFHSSIRSIWTVYYFAYKSEFVQACINRDKPDMHCDGKCALMSRMEQTPSEKDIPAMPSALQHLDEIIYDIPVCMQDLTGLLPAFETYTAQFLVINGHWKVPLANIFKPPS